MEDSLSRLVVRLFLVVIVTFVACTGSASAAEAQSPAGGRARTVRGIVEGSDSRPIDAANVFIIETLEGAVTREDGRFAIPTAATGPLTLIVRRLGFTEQRRIIAESDTASLVFKLAPSGVSLAAVAVQAGQYTASEERGATLTPLEVVTTPGTAADVNRAIQSLPGVQAGDEGTALFVRGGDFTETRVFLNDAGLLTPVQLQSPSGTFTGTVDPFLLDGIFFSSGGFGARYGDALSGIAALKTQGRPSRSSATVSAGLAALSGSGALKLSPDVSLRFAGNRSNLEPMFRLNGTRRSYDPPPHGSDLSGSAIVSYRETGEVKLFAIQQTNALAFGVEDASYDGNFSVDSHGRLGVATWRDVFGVVSPTVTLAASHNESATDFGAFRLANQSDHAQLFAQAEWSAPAGITMRAGGELDRLDASYKGSIPASGYDVKPGARTTVIASERTGDRTAGFVEADWRPLTQGRLVAGVRTDRSTLTDERTVDPRLSAAWVAALGVTFTAALGVYHQVPDPLYFDDSLSAGSALASMRARQRILGAQVGGEARMLRIEAYDKRYEDLAQRTRDYGVVTGGRGTARGMDVFAKGTGPLGTTGRLSYSYVSSRRTDPDAGVVTRSAFDVTHTMTAVAERSMFGGLRASVAYRFATGRPFTPVSGATYDAQQRVFVPSYGAPMSERLPDFRRLDFSTSYFRQLSPSLQSVVFVSLMNVLDRNNAQRYRYNADYSQRHLVSSLFERSVYFGGTITWLRENR
ncbi:MAG TPA: carboxypeptidase-like regulatory domain-containing protein [Gemmatimonadaceae bacterium]|nr:carboxypeptidase-like regulatory domain-containing protein [Gemmatimonadaceae bacterium]